MGAGIGWVVVRQALASDTCSEQTFWPRKVWDSLEAGRADEPVTHGGLQAVEFWLERSWVWGSACSGWNWNSSSPLFSTLSSPDIPFSFFLSYFPSLPQAEFTALYGDGALEEARRLREGNWASVRTVLTGAVALGALVTVGAFFASK